MIRNRKRKEVSLLEELKEMELLEEGEMVDIPDLEFEDLIEENTLSVIVRCLNPYAHKVGGLVKALPPIWGMEDRVRGRGVGEQKVQFIFNSDNDLQFVLNKGPWFVNGWMVALDQWSPNPHPEFLQRIPFWIRIRGLPIHLLKKEIVESLLGPLGEVGPVELHAKNSDSLEYVRARVSISTEEPLQFRRIARFRSGETVPTELEYEKLLKVCYTCKKLTHDQTKCPLQAYIAPEFNRGPQGKSLKANLRSKLLEKEVRAKEALTKDPIKESKKGQQELAESSRGRRNNAVKVGIEDKRRGKRVATSSQKVWKQKGVSGDSRTSKSTEESMAKTCSISKEGPEMNKTPGSVFNRLGSSEKDSGSGGRNRSSRSHIQEHDLRISLSGGSQGERLEGKSSKGSRSPPIVFERLGSPCFMTPREEKGPEGSTVSKRRRQSGSSEGRKAKKARRGAQEIEKVAPSVFQRLGGTELGSGSSGGGQEVLDHSAHVAAYTPVHAARGAANFPGHSVRRIALASGTNWKEGLMGNSNPSRSI
ncbi:Uncharacterized protein Rs2_47984 [Raphanus sativus]|uniref:Uncharacterized protein LOC108820423 n=1 Tax=Raphanus sativus TaxID=3726 RepID=A0A6J0KPA9_RAPSA|nr:uncharacterized protein LOC108820423 [Raphanus sativus]KAJ4870406.1 Uncharacterized protein Rs2_47984 [Raphanus sativus]